VREGPPARGNIGQGRRVAQDCAELAGEHRDIFHIGYGDATEAAREPLMARHLAQNLG